MTSVGICFVRIGISIRTTDGSGSVARIHVVDWRPDWPEAFERAPVEIEHVGSTSVPGFAAKSIIDTCVGVERLEVVEQRLAAFESLGYAHGELKRELARDFAGDRTGYTEAKSAFIASALSASTTL